MAREFSNKEKEFIELICRGYSNSLEFLSQLESGGLDWDFLVKRRLESGCPALYLITTFAGYSTVDSQKMLTVLNSLEEDDTYNVDPGYVIKAADQIILLGGDEDYFHRVNDLAFGERCLRNYWEQIKSGNLHPYVYGRNFTFHDQFLEALVNQGITTKSQIDQVIERMNQERVGELHQDACIEHEKYHTPFAQDKETLKDFGFPVFIGRSVFPEGHENYCEITSTGHTGFASLSTAVNMLWNNVCTQRRVLLTKDPGHLPSKDLSARDLKAFTEQQLGMIWQSFEENHYGKLALLRGYEHPLSYQPEEIELVN